MRSAAPVLALAATLALTPLQVNAQAYPSQDIRFICAFPAGSGADVLVRYFAEKARTVANRTIIVENRAGASGNIAQEYVARSKPDGYTIFVHGATGVTLNQSLFKKPPIDAATHLQVVATINRQPFMLVVDARKPWKTVAELTADVKPKGDKASYGHAAAFGQIMGEIYKNATGVKAVDIGYRTAPDSLNDQLSGATDYGMHDPVYALSQEREGRLRILAVSTNERIKAISHIPTMSEQGIPMDLLGWWAAIVPSGTPRPIQETIHQWFVTMVSIPRR
jgi:tripartite-type tricarboxylate transporter receptor subunit TctC